MKSFLQFLLLITLLPQISSAQWTQQSSGVSSILYCTNFVDSSMGFASGGNQTLLKTTDGGNNWIVLDQGGSDDEYGAMFIKDLQTGWIALNGWSPRHSSILKTTDGGISWITQIYIDGHLVPSIFFIDDQIGWLVGTNGIIYNTINGGDTWNLQYELSTGEWLYDIFFIDQNIGWVVGNLGDKILKTTDGGSSWQWIPCGATDWLFDIEFIDQNTGIAVGDNGRILKSTDGGSSWNIVQSGTTSMLREVEYINLGQAWIVGHDGVILHSTDNGITWALQTSGTTEHFLDVSFTNANNGTAVGFAGIILRTTNGGSNIAILPTWSNEIVVEDAGGIESSEVLTFGQHSEATDSIDLLLGEYELPPPPPTGIFDARFNLPTNPLVSSFIDYRDSARTEIIWNISFQPGSTGYPMTFSWDSTSFPEGTFYLKDPINGSFVFVNMKEQSSYTLTEPAITSLNISYKGNCSLVSVNNEWNMISVPLLAEDMSISNLFSTATSSAYGYDGGYVTEDTLVAGVGYWLKFGGNEQIQICGSTPGDTVGVQTGWNIIGLYEEDKPVNQITTAPPGIIATFFFGFEDGYYIADTLKSGKGYWVRVTEDGILNLNGGPLTKGVGERQIAKLEQDWGKIKITDNEGKSIILFATEEELELNLFELPPMPPSGIFDSRYSSGRLVENLSSEKTIIINSDNYPITIKIEGLSLNVRDMINGEMLNEELKNGEEIIITNNKITSIEVAGRITGGLPITYELYQNYPNPFNPSTTIKFAVPKESNVNLSIYNVLGELVTSLVNEQMKAGYYEYEFNASSLSSGVYLYRISAGDFNQTKKLILLK